MVARQLYNGLVSQPWTLLISYAVSQGYPIVISEVGGLGSSGKTPQEVLGLSLGKTVSSSRMFVDSPEYGLEWLVQATGKIGCCHGQQTAGQEAGCSPMACLCFGGREELGWSRAAAESEVGFLCCSICCSSCLFSSFSGNSNGNLSSSGFSFPSSLCHHLTFLFQELA